MRGFAFAMAALSFFKRYFTRYGMPGMGEYAPAAAMDVLDLDPQRIGDTCAAVKTLDGGAAEPQLQIA